MLKRGMGQWWRRGGKDDCLDSISLVASGVENGGRIERGEWRIGQIECRELGRL